MIDKSLATTVLVSASAAVAADSQDLLLGLDPLVAVPVLVLVCTGLLYGIKLLWGLAMKNRDQVDTLRTNAMNRLAHEMSLSSAENTTHHHALVKEIQTTRHEARQDRTVIRGDIGALRNDMTQAMAEIRHLRFRVDRTESDIKDILGMLGDRRKQSRPPPE